MFAQLVEEVRLVVEGRDKALQAAGRLRTVGVSKDRAKELGTKIAKNLKKQRPGFRNRKNEPYDLRSEPEIDVQRTRELAYSKQAKTTSTAAEKFRRKKAAKVEAMSDVARERRTKKASAQKTARKERQYRATRRSAETVVGKKGSVVPRESGVADAVRKTRAAAKRQPHDTLKSKREYSKHHLISGPIVKKLGYDKIPPENAKIGSLLKKSRK